MLQMDPASTSRAPVCDWCTVSRSNRGNAALGLAHYPQSARDAGIRCWYLFECPYLRFLPPKFGASTWYWVLVPSLLLPGRFWLRRMTWLSDWANCCCLVSWLMLYRSACRRMEDHCWRIPCLSSQIARAHQLLHGHLNCHCCWSVSIFIVL